jgi:adenine-specific DNA-methyltransferase
MATGVVRGERHGKDTLLATSSHSDPFPLPTKGGNIRLEYSGKVEESLLLKPLSTSYSEVNSSGVIANNCGISANCYMLSDNFVGLHAILKEGIRPKLIYLDPPYGTGMEFQARDLEHAYTDSMSEAQYIEYMRRRLILMREILSDDGSIYIHIGHQMVGHLKVIMDEIFGVSSFKNIITRRKCSSKNFTKNQYSNIHDYILFYTKSSNYIWNQPGMEPEQEWLDKEYPKEDKKGKYKLVPVHAPGTRRGETGMEWRGMLPPPGKHWQYRPELLDQFDAAGDIHWSKTGNPRRKVYLQSNKLVFMTDYWEKFRDAHHQSIRITGYPTEKNFEMMKLIVGASSNPGDIVLDPFCGSGTTLHASQDMGRKWIGIDNSMKSAKTVVHRFKNGLEVMGDYVVRANSISQPSLFAGSDMEMKPVGDKVDYSFFADSWVVENHLSDIKALL